MDYKLLADEILTRQLKANDESAFKEIYNRYWRVLFTAAYYRLGSREVAQELIQNLFLHIWENRSSLTVNNLKHYLQTSVKNRIINHFESTLVQKKWQQHIREKARIQSSEIEALIHYKELNLAFENAVQLLPPKKRDVFRLSRFEQLSTREIADRLNISEKAVEYHITTSLKVLRLSLKDFMAGSIFLVTLWNL